MSSYLTEYGTEPTRNNVGQVYKQYDQSGISTVEHSVTALSYNARGQRTDIYYGNGSKTRYEYNPHNFRLTRLLSTRNTGQDILQDLRYTYDPEGNITELTDDAQQTLFFANREVNPRSTYEYDALYRLLKATGRELNGLGMPNENDYTGITAQPDDHSAVQLYTRTYTYDELGNMLTEKNVSRTTVWTRTNNYNFPENNYLRSHNDEPENAYLYDAHGNMTKMPHLQAMKYDYANQLHDVTLDASGNKAYYVYDSGGNRVRKVVEKGNITEERFYIGNYEYFTKTNNGTVEEERETIHVKDDKQVIALIDNDIQSSLFTIRYQLTNHLDSASLELDHEANIISYEEYHPFGTTSYRSGRNEAEVSLKRYKYVFKELDNETGLYYYGMRYYAPWLARFISVDPLQHSYPQLTPFQYAGNKPISHIDIDGMEGTGDENRSSVKLPTVFDATNPIWAAGKCIEPIVWGTNNLSNFENGATDRLESISSGIAQSIISAGETIYDYVTLKNLKYGNGLTTLTFGLPPGYKADNTPTEVKMAGVALAQLEEFAELGYNAIWNTDSYSAGVLTAELAFFAIGGVESKAVNASSKTLYRGLKFNKELEYIWKDYYSKGITEFTIEPNAWKYKNIHKFDPMKPDFSMAARHTSDKLFAHNESPLMSFTENRKKAFDFAGSNGVVFKIEIEKTSPFLKQNSRSIYNESEWYYYGPAKANIFDFVPHTSPLERLNKYYQYK